MNTATRHADLKQILIERRRELENDVQTRIRERRIEQNHDVGDHVDTSDAHNQGDIEFALLQMRAGTLTRISEALVRLEAGRYGTCLSCGCEIMTRRLRALPFAVRCQGCEEQNEIAQDRSRHPVQPRESSSLFPDVIG
jgi:RNA polymerase-binding transcription factor